MRGSPSGQAVSLNRVVLRDGGELDICIGNEAVGPRAGYEKWIVLKALDMRNGSSSKLRLRKLLWICAWAG